MSSPLSTQPPPWHTGFVRGVDRGRGGRVVARVPRLEHIHVTAAGDAVAFDWSWEGRREVEVLVLLVIAGLLIVVMFGGFIFGDYAFDEESQPLRVRVMGVMAAIALVCVLAPARRRCARRSSYAYVPRPR